MNDTERWLHAALGEFAPDELAQLEERVSGLPKAIWGVIGLVIVVVVALVWLNIHDRDIRKTAELQTVLDAKTDTIRTLNQDIAQLGKAIKAADSAYLAATGTVIRVAYVPQSVKDSLAVLSRALDLAVQRGDSTVPIGTAVQLGAQLKACTVQRDTIVAAVSTMASACDRAKADRDSVIAAQKQIVRQMTDQLVATQKLAGLSQPRLVPFAGADYSLLHHAWDIDAGARLRLFSGLNLRASVGYRDSLDAKIGGEWQFR